MTSLRALFVLYVLCAPWVRAAPSSSIEGDGLGVDANHEVLGELFELGQPRLPTLGPSLTHVTVDVALPLGHPNSTVLLDLVLRLGAKDPDLRLVFHPVSSNSQGERGMAILWEAMAQDRFWTFCPILYRRPDLALPGQESALREAAAAAGLPAARVLQAAQTPLRRDLLRALQQTGPRGGPELWINGASSHGLFSEGILRDAITLARARAIGLLQQGVPRPQLAARLWAQPPNLDGDGGADRLMNSRFGGRTLLSPFAPPAFAPSARLRGPGGLLMPGPVGRVTLDLRGAPSCGPRLAPVTLVLVANFDSYRSYGYTIAAREVFRRHGDRIRLFFKHAPVRGGVNSTAPLLAQLHAVAPASFWPAVDQLSEAQARRFHLTEAEAQAALREVGVDVVRLHAGLADGRAQRQVQEDGRQLRAARLPEEPLLLLNGQVLTSAPGIRGLEELVRHEEDRGLISRLLAE